ncbi:DUF6048 family protein [Fulvivirga sedimenti]|uniref:DUF6048 family protein n=1 Tax=Fulvivirga sedimenti TaxID=2879465 RepID=A0A9X1HKP1_9BACT|nr:DUF6048 family protein [Fulvivirga sedimenti]MCA6073656.1 DUF6048 family protein [Fulvivirga sedimenti]
MRKLFFICSLVLGHFLASGQDSVNVSRMNNLPRLFVLVDYGKLATLPTDFEDKLEAGIGIRIGKHITPVLYAGKSTLLPGSVIENGQYSSEGWYIRTGIEYYASLDGKNNLLMGLRYGYTVFSESASYVISSPLFEDVTGFVERTDLSANWAEVVLGSEMRLGDSKFYLGGYLTLRVLINREEFDPIDTYSIPGYGRTFDKTIPALQLYLKFALIR